MDAASLSFFMQCGVPPWRELVKTRGIVGTPLLEIAHHASSPPRPTPRSSTIAPTSRSGAPRCSSSATACTRGDDADLRRHRDARLRPPRHRRTPTGCARSRFPKTSAPSAIADADPFTTHQPGDTHEEDLASCSPLPLAAALRRRRRRWPTSPSASASAADRAGLGARHPDARTASRCGRRRSPARSSTSSSSTTPPTRRRRQERAPLHHRGQGRPDRRLGRDAGRRGDGRRRRRRQDGAAHALAGEPAAGQGRLVVPHAAVDRGDGDPDRRAHGRSTGVKTVGFLGYTDAYGEAWLKDITPLAEKAGIKLVATERFARTDTSVTGQALKLMSANPDAILVVASGSGAAMPHKGLVERGYQGQDLPDARRGDDGPDPRRRRRRRGLVRRRPGPAVVAEQLPDEQRQQGARHEVRAASSRRPTARARRNQFAGHAYDVVIVLREGGADGAEEGQARHAGVPRRAEGRVRDDGPHAGLAGRAQLDRDRPLRLHRRDRRDAEGRRTATGKVEP